MRTLILALMTVTAIPVWGQTGSVRIPTTVNSEGGGGDVAPVPSSSNVTITYTDRVVVRLNNSCFGTNLRSVSNPVSPYGTIAADMTLEAAGVTHTIGVTYPGQAVSVAGGGVQTPTTLSGASLRGPSGTTGSVYGNTVQIIVPVTFTSTTDGAGNITQTPDRISVTNSTFNQVVDCSANNCGVYMGQNGPLSGNIGSPVASADNSTIDINVSFPGQTGFCGGYFSPLMVFQDDARPQFTGVTDFPLHDFGKTYWPEAGSPGAFIAFDRDKNGKIDKRDELFGDSDKAKNGFESFRAMDSNNDGWVDSKDKHFKQLVLWTDKNSNGISEKGETVKLSKTIEKISLNYSKGHLRPIGLHAEEREVATVYLKNKKTIQVVDVWFAPYLKSNEKLSDNRQPASKPSN